MGQHVEDQIQVDERVSQFFKLGTAGVKTAANVDETLGRRIRRYGSDHCPELAFGKAPLTEIELLFWKLLSRFQSQREVLLLIQMHRVDVIGDQNRDTLLDVV